MSTETRSLYRQYLILIPGFSLRLIKVLLPRISFLWILFLILVNYLFPTRVRSSTLFTHPPNFILFPTMSDFPPNLSIRPLTIQDIDQCVELEAKGFPPEERCSREKFNYRLTVAPELCAGLFVREYDYKYNAINLPEVAEKLQKQHQDEDDDDDELPSHSSVLKETLIGHVIATKSPRPKSPTLPCNCHRKKPRVLATSKAPEI